MSTVKVQLDDIEKEMDKIFSDFLNSSFKIRQKAVQKGAEVLKRKAEMASPTDTGDFSSKWSIKTKYKDHRYVGNTKTVSGRGADGRYHETIPLINILEYNENTAFFRQTYDACENEIFQAIKNELEGGK